MIDAASAPPRRRRRFRLSLRALMALVLVIGGTVGWLIQAARTQRAGVAAVRAAGGFVRYDWQFAIDPQGRMGSLPATEPAAPRWLRRWLGDELFQSVEQVSLFEVKSTATLAAVGRFDGLEILFLTDRAGDEVDYGDLRRLRRLRFLNLAGSGITDSKLAAVGAIASLRSLVVEQSPATDAGFARLAGLRNLTHLTLWDLPHLTDAGLSRALAGMPRLRGLDLAGFRSPLPATVEGLARTQSGLKALDLGVAPATAAGLAAIGRLTRLEHLSVNGAGVPDSAVAHLAELVKLRELHLDDVPVTDAGLASLAGLAALEGLYLNQARVTDAGLATLARFPGLTGLTLSGARITDAGLPTLARLANLRSLNLDDNPGITDKGMIPAHFGPSLELLGVGGTKVTQAGSDALAAARPSLTIQPEEGLAPGPTPP